MRSAIQVIFLIAFFALALAVSVLSTTSSATAGQIQLPTCLFRVTFPGEPEVGEHSAPIEGGFVRWYVATQKTRAAFLRHECMCVRNMNHSRMSEAFVRQRLTEFARATGLSNIVFSPTPFPYGIALSLRGYKNIQGTPATYEGTAFITNDCYLDLVVGAPSTDFPPPERSTSRNSLTLQPSTETGPPGAHCVAYQRAPTGAVRSIDLNHLSTTASIVTYLQRFQTSCGGKVVLSKNQIHCGTGEGRTEEGLFFDSDGVLLSAIQYSLAESPFAPVPNDPSMPVLRPVCCEGRVPVPPSKVRARLRAAGLELK